MDGLPRRLGIAWTVSWAHLAALTIMLLPPLGKTMRLFGEGLLYLTGAEGWGLTLHVLALLSTGALLYQWGRGDGRLSWWFLGAGACNLLIPPFGLVPAALFFWLARQPTLVEAAERMPVRGGAAKTRLTLLWLGADAALLLVNIPVLFLVSGLVFLWFPATLLTAALPGALLWRLFQEPSPGMDPVEAMPRLPDL